jgi:hypothetical protein
LLAGDGQSGVAGALLSDSIAARVEDRFKNPVPGVSVQWSAGAAHGTLSPATRITAADGIARAAWTLGLTVGQPQSAIADVTGLTRATVRATARPPSDARLSMVAGDQQRGGRGATLRDSLVVRLTTADGRPLVGAIVRWSATEGGGSLLAAQSATGLDGRAVARWTLGM